MDQRLVQDIRLGERRLCVDALRAMARAADAQPSGITLEGGVPPEHASRILNAAADLLEVQGTLEGSAAKLIIESKEQSDG